MKDTCRIRGRLITEHDITVIREIVRKYFHKGRKHISRQLCHHWNWYQPNGNTKDMACREVLLFLDRQHLITLPPPLHSGNNDRRCIEPITLEEVPLEGTLKDHASLNLRLLSTPSEYKLWNRIVQSYHYQGYKIIVGHWLKYMAFIQGRPVACLGWGSAAWSVSSRDKWIGWSKEVKDKNLFKIVNNIRFLILPWVKVKYLASHLLSLNIRRIGRDWVERFGSPIYLGETFVEKDRFPGTCYKASNWINLGETKGSAKKGNSHTYHGKLKEVYVYPLCRGFRDELIRVQE